MTNEYINPLQARILNRFYTSKFRAYEPSFLERFFGLKEILPTRWREQDIIENLGIKGEKDRDYFTESFYDLIKKGMIKEDKSDDIYHSYLMTRKGLNTLYVLKKGDLGRLEKYSSSKETESAKENKLGRIVQNIAASALILFGMFLAIRGNIITGAISFINIPSEGFIFGFGLLLIIVGFVLFLIKR